MTDGEKRHTHSRKIKRSTRRLSVSKKRNKQNNIQTLNYRSDIYGLKNISILPDVP